jgi:hypothetical protein
MSYQELGYLPVRGVGDLERQKLTAVGCVVVVVNNEGKVYVVEEKDKSLGLNVLTETRKQGEFIADNVRGALVEEMGVSNEDKENFLGADGRVSYLGRVGFEKNGGMAAADVCLVFYGGEKRWFRSRNEVEGINFWDLETLLSSNLRPAVKPALEFVQEKSGIAKLLATINSGYGEEIFPTEFNVEVEFLERLERDDLKVNDLEIICD